MKKIFLLIMLFPLFGFAQINEGLVKYTVTTFLDIELPPEYKMFQAMIPKEITSNKELYFTETESLYKSSALVEDAETDPFATENMMLKGFKMMNGGENVVYTNYNKNKRILMTETMGQKFLITSQPKESEWTIINEQVVIAGYTCMKAVKKQSTTFSGMPGRRNKDKDAEADSSDKKNDKGGMQFNIPDSSQVTVWFTPQIPISTGPEEFDGLPGMVLKVEVDAGDAKTMYVAQEVIEMETKSYIKKPKGGQKVTQEEYLELLEQRMKETEGEHRGPGGGGGRGMGR